MKRLLLALLLLASVCCNAQTVPVGLTKPNGFTYTLPADESVTSCGIYSPDGKTLIRTLWSNVPKKAGKNVDYWDGLDDLGNVQTYGLTYVVKVIANNDIITWEGVIGNNSTNLSGATVHRGGTGIVSMVQIGSKFNCAQAFSERNTSQFKFDTAAPLIKVEYKTQGQTYQGSTFVVANATYKFWGGKDYQGAHNFIYAELVSNDVIVNLSAGASFTGTPPMGNYAKVIDLNALGINGAITGMALQSASSTNGYLFVSHKAQNIINVYKTSDGSGSFVRSIAITAPTSIKLENDGSLWVGQGTTVTKYTVNSDGTITSTSREIIGLSRVAALDIQGINMLIVDAGTQQVVKEYSTSSLSLIRTIGSVGGYQNTPTVSNTRFYLEDLTGQYLTYVAFQSDGTWWLGDTGNARSLHFSATGIYLNQIMFIPEYFPLNDGTVIPITYNVNLCYGQNTALFLRFLEFTIDYSQPLSSGWALTNNYGYNYPAGWDQGNPVEAVALLSNSRRYMHVFKKGTTNSYLAELTSTGLRINTGYTVPVLASLGADGYLTNLTTTGPSSAPVLTYNRYPLTGFDGSNNPTYGTVTHSSAISMGATYPVPLQRDWVVTTSNKLILFDNTVSATRSGGLPIFHLGAYDLTSSALAWRTARSTFSAYSGPFPKTAIFDVGNLVKYPGGSAVAIGNNVFYNYHGENWQNAQTGILYMFDDGGLFKGMAGLVGPQVSGIAPAGYFTNALTTSATIQGGNYYLYFNDESMHSAIHRWKISNTSSENTQTTFVKLSNRVFTPTPNKTDLLAGLPDNQFSVQGVTNWTQLPTVDVTTGANQFYTKTRKNVFDYTLSPDVAITYSGTTTGDYLARKLTSLTSISQWTITGEFLMTFNTFKGSELTGSHNKVYVEVSDNAGKAIARIYFYTTNRIGFNNTFFGPYNGIKYGTSAFVIKRVGSNVYFSMDLWGTQLTTPATGLPMYDVTADPSKPASISWHFVFPTADFAYGTFSKLKFEGK